MLKFVENLTIKQVLALLLFKKSVLLNLLKYKLHLTNDIYAHQKAVYKIISSFLKGSKYVVLIFFF